MRGRGLKHCLVSPSEERTWSPPMRGRGLKHHEQGAYHYRLMSPPMRGRGLKHFNNILNNKNHDVAPHAGAWIETHS